MKKTLLTVKCDIALLFGLTEQCAKHFLRHGQMWTTPVSRFQKLPAASQICVCLYTCSDHSLCASHNLKHSWVVQLNPILKLQHVCGRLKSLRIVASCHNSCWFLWNLECYKTLVAGCRCWICAQHLYREILKTNLWLFGIRTQGKDLRYPDYYISTNIDNCSGFCSLLNRTCFW